MLDDLPYPINDSEEDLTRSWVRSGRLRSGFVVEFRISSATANSTEAEKPLRRTADCEDKGDLDLQMSFVA